MHAQGVAMCFKKHERKNWATECKRAWSFLKGPESNRP